MKILVTGGAGFIGSHTCVELLNEGHEVVIIDNLYNSSRDVIGKIEHIAGRPVAFYEEDLLDKDAVRKIWKEHSIDAVIHFAGYKAVGESVAKPLEYYRNNLDSTLTLLEVMREFDCKKIIFSSSATVYGMNNPVPFTEGSPVSATNPYGYTKVVIERILTDLSVAEPDWSIVLLRYFNPVGAHESGLIGEKPNGIPNNLMPYVNMVAKGELPYLRVFGNDYETPDGTGVRDYIHVVDLAKGHLAALNYALNHKGAEAVNLGTGHGSSVLEMIRAFEDATGIHIPYEICERRPGDIATAYADTEKAKKVFHWQAEKDLTAMCKDGWNFAKSIGNNL